jgi:hypothetical protein
MALESTQSLTEMSTRNLPWDNGQPACKADNLTATCESNVQKMWEPRRLTALWASTACYRDSFTFSTFYLILPHYGPGVDSESNRNEYQESSLGQWAAACKADNLTATCEPNVQKIWEPRRLTTLWASTACYRDSSNFSPHFVQFWPKFQCFRRFH